MFRRMVVGVGLFLLASSPLMSWALQGDASKQDLEKFQGTWTFTGLDLDGKSMLKKDEVQIITFAGDKFTVKVGDKVVQAGTHKLDASKTPKTVDATVTEGESKGNTMLGIYEFKGNQMKACFDPAGKKRPTEFKSYEGTGIMLVTIERMKKK